MFNFFGNLSMTDFTLNSYIHLLTSLKQKVGSVFGVLQWHQDKPIRGVLIRHDVDRKPINAMKMAEAEAKMGVYTTYYFRVVGSAFNKKIIKEISELGHEVGYHYEDLALAKGDLVRAHESFKKNLSCLREITAINTIAMHGSPLSRYNNIDLWRIKKLSDYELKADAFLTVDYSGVPYFTDTGRSWSATSTNLRDKPESAKAPPRGIKKNGDLLNFINSEQPMRVALSAHPERWAISMTDWSVQLFKDSGINAVKRALKLFR